MLFGRWLGLLNYLLKITKMIKTKTISATICIKEYSSIVIEAVNGYLKQTLPPLEIIVVGKKSVLKRLKEKFQRKEIVKFVNFSGEKNDARNTAIASTKGDYVIFSDHDMVPSKNLIEECLKSLNDYGALIIPEIGAIGGKLSNKVFRLEKEIVQTDPDAASPRLFKKSLFGKEKPFDPIFGVLDEWGFHINLRKKKPKIGLVQNSFFKVKDGFSISERVVRSYRKGFWFKNLLRQSDAHVKRRANPFRRGIIVYFRNINILLKEPFVAIILIFIKGIEFLAFLAGLLFSGYLIPKNIAYEKNY